MVVVIFITWCCQASLSFLPRQHKLQCVHRLLFWCLLQSSPPLTLSIFSPFTLFHCVMEMELEDPVGSINWSCLQSGVDPGLRRTLCWASCCDKAGPHSQATQENEREKVALLWSPCIISHSKWQPSTQAQMPTDAGVSARGVCVDVWMFVCVSVFFWLYATASVKACSIQYPSQPNNLD